MTRASIYSSQKPTGCYSTLGWRLILKEDGGLEGFRRTGRDEQGSEAVEASEKEDTVGYCRLLLSTMCCEYAALLLPGGGLLLPAGAYVQRRELRHLQRMRISDPLLLQLHRYRCASADGFPNQEI
jgi:hypothetical protein